MAATIRGLNAGRLVLDVSNVNPLTSAAELRRSGAVALIAKATEGDSYLDVTCGAHRTFAHEAGVPFGAYLFLRVGSPGNEAREFLDFARPQPGDIQPVIDAEDLAEGVTRLARRAESCANELMAHGYRPILYCSASVWPQLAALAPPLAHLRVWEADYPGRFTRWFPRLARLRVRLLRGATVVLWQWTDDYRVDGHGFDASRLLVPLETLLIPKWKGL